MCLSWSDIRGKESSSSASLCTLGCLSPAGEAKRQEITPVEWLSLSSKMHYLQPAAPSPSLLSPLLDARSETPLSSFPPPTIHLGARTCSLTDQTQIVAINQPDVPGRFLVLLPLKGLTGHFSDDSPAELCLEAQSLHNSL